MDVWRIFSFADLSGRGGLLADGRWHARGTPVVYCADHPSTAMLEILVHLDRDDIPANYQLLKIVCPDDAPIGHLDDIDPRDVAQTREAGSNLLAQNRHLLIAVPSLVMPAAPNFLLNPNHVRAGELAIVEIYRYPFDPRLKR